jgi:hypothetical protein
LLGLALLVLASAGADGKSARVTFRLTDGTGATPCALSTQLEGLVSGGAQSLNGTASAFQKDTTGVCQGATTATTAGTPAATAGNPSVSAGVRVAAFSPLLCLALASLVATLFSRQRGTLAVCALLLVAGFVSVSGVDAQLTKTYQNCRVLDGQSDFRLHWTISGANVEFGVEAKSTGWLALGVSSGGTMNSGGAPPGTDIALGFIDSTVCPTGCMSDYFTTVRSAWLLPRFLSVFLRPVSRVFVPPPSPLFLRVLWCFWAFLMSHPI